MQKSLFITSTKSEAGKTVFVMGLSSYVKSQGKSVSYFKPIGDKMVKKGDSFLDLDVALFRSYLSIKNDQPLIINYEGILKEVHDKHEEIQNKFGEIYDKLTKENDIVLIEGGRRTSYGAYANLSGAHICSTFNIPAIIIASGTTEQIVDVLSMISAYYKQNNCKVLGVILNKIPYNEIESTKQFVIPAIEELDLKVYGIIPEKTMLKSISVKEIAKRLNAEVLAGEAGLNKRVKEYLVGAMTFENALRYFRQYKDKAVITGGDRADIQLAALETPTSCLVLSGNLYPSTPILVKADEKEVPVLLVPDDTLTVTKNIEALVSRITSKDIDKIKLIEQLVTKHLNCDEILADLQKMS